MTNLISNCQYLEALHTNICLKLSLYSEHHSQILKKRQNLLYHSEIIVFKIIQQIYNLKSTTETGLQGVRSSDYKKFNDFPYTISDSKNFNFLGVHHESSLERQA